MTLEMALRFKLSAFWLCLSFLLISAKQPPFAVILVEARHLDYSSLKTLLKTTAKHPSDMSKNGDVGHAWIYLEGDLNGKRFSLEGGHSGETATIQPRYFEGVINASLYGSPNAGIACAEFEWDQNNPASYLYCQQKDGFFQKGAGGHTPTYAARFILNDQQFKALCRFIRSYDFSNYRLTSSQCVSFAAKVGELAGCPLQYQITLQVPQYIEFDGCTLQLWKDQKYSSITLPTPDVLEASLKKAVVEGKAIDAKVWYERTHPVSFETRWKRFWNTVRHFPSRFMRYAKI